jgi:hypothetical protein
MTLPEAQLPVPLQHRQQAQQHPRPLTVPLLARQPHRLRTLPEPQPPQRRRQAQQHPPQVPLTVPPKAR